jgi:hypothetical protein
MFSVIFIILKGNVILLPLIDDWTLIKAIPIPNWGLQMTTCYIIAKTAYLYNKDVGSTRIMALIYGDAVNYL